MGIASRTKIVSNIFINRGTVPSNPIVINKAGVGEWSETLFILDSLSKGSFNNDGPLLDFAIEYGGVRWTYTPNGIKTSGTDVQGKKVKNFISHEKIVEYRDGFYTAITEKNGDSKFIPEMAKQMAQDIPELKRFSDSNLEYDFIAEYNEKGIIRRIPGEIKSLAGGHPTLLNSSQGTIIVTRLNKNVNPADFEAKASKGKISTRKTVVNLITAGNSLEFVKFGGDPIVAKSYKDSFESGYLDLELDMKVKGYINGQTYLKDIFENIMFEKTKNMTEQEAKEYRSKRKKLLTDQFVNYSCGHSPTRPNKKRVEMVHVITNPGNNKNRVFMPNQEEEFKEYLWNVVSFDTPSSKTIGKEKISRITSDGNTQTVKISNMLRLKDTTGCKIKKKPSDEMKSRLNLPLNMAAEGKKASKFIFLAKRLTRKELKKEYDCTERYLKKVIENLEKKGVVVPTKAKNLAELLTVEEITNGIAVYEKLKESNKPIGKGIRRALGIPNFISNSKIVSFFSK